MDKVNDIFVYIENKMKVAVPVYMKYILKCFGYDNCHTIATIEDADIEYFADEVRKGRVNDFYRGKMNAEDVMEGCARSFENFEFSRGHRQLLQLIVKMVKDTLEIDGADAFWVKLPKAPKTLQEKGNTNSRAASYRKRFKFSTDLSTVAQDEEAMSHVKVARSNLIRKAILSLITHTPKLYANNFERMLINKVLIQVELEIEEEAAHICCPYCLKSIGVSLSDTKRSNKPWWNTSNFDRHLDQIHKDIPIFDLETDSQNMPQSTNNEITTRRPVEDRQLRLFAAIEKKECGNFNPLNVMLQIFVNSAERNVNRKKAGYRFDELTKMFAAYIFMISGTLAYETLNANLPLSLPSVSTVHRFITDKGPRVIEGEMRSDELRKYLLDRNLPLQVSLSEDATRITAKVSYDPITNQLLGFALPLDKNGMPIKFSFPARSVREIQSHFFNPSNFVSSTAYVQMAQPLDENSAPFCLMIYLIDNTFTANNVLKRWRFQASKLKEKGITINNISTDGDSRPLMAMKILSRIGQSDKSYLNCEWFSCGGYCETTFMQDLIHILTKLRNRLLTCSRLFPIGNKIVSLSHLKFLIENVSKDKHLLTSYDIEPKDRQNYLSAAKICSENTTRCLTEYVPGCEATVIYLKAMRGISIAFSDDSNLQSTERIYHMWSSVFFFRAWRSWLLNSEKIDPSQKKSKNFYTLKENFISSNCYTCIELNAHALVKKILTEDSSADNSVSEIFFSNLYGSQPCENTFRQLRSFTSTFSTVVNFNILDIIHRIDKTQLQNDIINNSGRTIKFPRFEKKADMAKTSGDKVLQKLNREAIISEIEKAKKDVIFNLEKLGIDASRLNFRCQVKPVFEQNMNDIDSDLDDSDSDEVDLLFVDVEDNQTADDSEDEHDEVLSDYLSGVTGELMLKDYSESFPEGECESSQCVDEKSPFVVVADGRGNKKVVRKSSICWMLSKYKHKLSSDRLVRVMERDYSVNTSAEKNAFLIADKFVVHNQITIGEWGIFFSDKGDKTQPKNLIGMVLGFTYLDGQTFKAREFSKASATVLSDLLSDSKDSRGVGVLCSFFTFDADGTLTAIPELQHKFLNIKSYVATIKPPIYENKHLRISEKLVLEIKNHTSHKK